MEQQRQSSLPPATHYHRVPIRAANRVLRVLQGLGVGKADLSEEGLMDAASPAGRLSDQNPLSLARRRAQAALGSAGFCFLQHEFDHLDGVLAVSRAVDGQAFALKSQK